MDFKKAKIEARKAGNTKKKKKILIALEDKKSQRFYIETLVKDKNINVQLIVAKHIGTNPKKVLEALNDHIATNPKEKYESKWIFIDKDSWTSDEFQGTIQSALSQNVHVIYSNESYELWLLLHFCDQTAPINRNDLKHQLKRYISDYDKGDENIYERTVSFQKDAISRAKILVDMHMRNHCIFDSKVHVYPESANDFIPYLDPFNDNPLTMLHEYINYLDS